MKLLVRLAQFIIAIAQSAEGGMAQHLELAHPYIKINSSGLAARKIYLLTNHLRMLQSFSVKPVAHHSLALMKINLRFWVFRLVALKESLKLM
jgi:hypothetical protein